MENGTGSGSVKTAQRRPRSARSRRDHDDDTMNGSQTSHEQTPLLSQDHHETRLNGEASESESYNDPDTIWRSERSEWLGKPWYQRPSVYWLYIPYIISTLAYGGIMVPKVNLILSLICREYYESRSIEVPAITIAKYGLGNEVDPLCRAPEVTARVSLFSLVAGLISGSLSAIIAPKLGALSDRYGRRPIMMICHTGALAGEIITIIAASIPQTFNVKWIFLASFLDGLTGSFTASMAVSQSYATDTTPPSRRNVIFGWFHACIHVGIALGPLLSGQIVQRTNNFIYMFYIGLGCHLTFICLLIFVIPESLTKKHRMAAKERHRKEVDLQPPTPPWSLRRTWSAFKSIFSPLKILYPRDDPAFTPESRRNLVLLASVDAIIFGVAMGAMTAVMLYSLNHFRWSVATQSYFISLVSFSRTGCLVVLLPLLTFFLRKRLRALGNTRTSGTDLFELSMIRLAIFFDMLGFIGYTFSTTTEMFMASAVVTSLGGIGSPNLQAALTKHVPPDRVGQLLGAMALLHAIARVASPLIFNSLFAVTVGKFDQALFVVLTVLFGVAWAVSWMIRPGVKLNWLDNEFLRQQARLTTTEANVEIDDEEEAQRVIP